MEVILEPELPQNLRLLLFLQHIKRFPTLSELQVIVKIARKTFQQFLMELAPKVHCNKLWELAKDLTSHNAFIKHF